MRSTEHHRVYTNVSPPQHEGVSPLSTEWCPNWRKNVVTTKGSGRKISKGEANEKNTEK